MWAIITYQSASGDVSGGTLPYGTQTWYGIYVCLCPIFNYIENSILVNYSMVIDV